MYISVFFLYRGGGCGGRRRCCRVRHVKELEPLQVGFPSVELSAFFRTGVVVSATSAVVHVDVSRSRSRGRRVFLYCSMDLSAVFGIGVAVYQM